MGSVLIVGAGAAGMMAAYSAARNGESVTVIEKNEKCGKKLYITGKGRCNLSNSCDAGDFFDNIVTNKKFMYSPFYTLTNDNVYDLFSDELGLKLKTERGGRVFPSSDKSSDVIGALVKALKQLNVNIILNTNVTGIITDNSDDSDDVADIISGCSLTAVGVKTDRGDYYADKIIIATGGMSYASTGSTGDGYTFAEGVGHSIIPTVPALVPMNIEESWVKDLQGLSLKNVSVKLLSDNKTLYSGFGEMLFTHFGVSGPIILSASSYICTVFSKGSDAHNKDRSEKGNKNIKISIDLKPALTYDQLDKRIVRDNEEQQNVMFKNSLSKLLPRKLIPVIVDLSGIDQYKQVNQITREERERLVKLIKNLKCTVSGLRDFNEAIITHGGINVKEINPATLESKLCRNLYFAGEVIDVDAVTGGFNLQVAWSTGYLAGLPQ